MSCGSMRAIAALGLSFLVLTACLTLAPDARAESRLALVIGNGGYRNTSRLVNPPNDAALMAATLKATGFAVTLVTDADQATMKRTLLDFSKALRKSDSVGLFYYAGHGMQVKGENYLIPIDANIEDEAEIPIQSVNVNEFLASMERSGSRINIVILDACRDNPFAASSRSGTRGLARVDAPAGSYIAYATAPGQVASDGAGGGNGPYAAAVAKAMTMPGLPLEQVFKKVRSDVRDATRSGQTPWETSSITGEFFFVPGEGEGQARNEAPPIRPEGGTPPAPDHSVEIAFWNTIKESDNAEAYRSYLSQFPSGSFTSLAKLKINELDARKAGPPPAPKPEPQPEPEPYRAPNRQARFAPAAMLPQSSRMRLNGNELSGLSCDQLWVARNEIFDRNGYCFVTPRGKAYFDNSNCTTSSQNTLNSTERANVGLIKSRETRLGCR